MPSPFIIYTIQYNRHIDDLSYISKREWMHIGGAGLEHMQMCVLPRLSHTFVIVCIYREREREKKTNVFCTPVLCFDIYHLPLLPSH
mmetsp:Transcript_25527/g.37453  ORF Transcript_25527/g.37453 Transcript_25527/m.37453 type:complete len:87 (-) Transcript_25527:15-275(-)